MLSPQPRCGKASHAIGRVRYSALRVPSGVSNHVVDFIEEVEEQLRSDRYASLVRRYGPWLAAALGAFILGWLGVWVYQTWQSREIAKAATAYDAAIGTLSKGDTVGAFSQLDPVAKSGPAAYRTLALIDQGNIRLAAGKTTEAAALYDAAAKTDAAVWLRDFAALRAAQALMDTAPLAQVQARLIGLIGDQKPFSREAREALALAKLQAGLTSDARNDLTALSLTLGVSPAMKGRAQAAVALIDAGEAASMVAMLKVAATLPPPAPVSADASQPTQQAPEEQPAQ